MISKRDLIVSAITAVLTLGAVSLAQTRKPLMRSSVFDWSGIEVKQTKTGARRDVFDAPTATLDRLESHLTTINVGESPHAPHQHPEEELIVIKEGTVDAMQNGTTKRLSPGSIIFEASNEPHGLRNAGQTPATYYVIKWFSPGALKSNTGPGMHSSVFEWVDIAVKQTRYGARRDVFESPTATLDQLECHVTTLNVGEAAQPPHQHAEEALTVVKEGKVEVTENGVTKRAGPGSLIFEASNEPHGIRNVGQTPATYYVIKWFSPGALKAKTGTSE